MFRYGLPVVCASVMMAALDASGRFFLNHYSTLEQVGLFAVGIKIASLMRMLVVAPFGVAWGGLLFQIEKMPQAQFIYSKLLAYVFLLAIAVVAILSLLSPALLDIFATPAYQGSLAVIPLLLMVQAITVMQYPSSVGIYLGTATKWLVPIFTSGLVVNIILNRLLVPRYGMIGAALAWLFSWIVIVALMLRIGQRYYPLRFEWKPALLAATVWLFVFALHQFGPFDLLWRSVVLKGTACLGIVLMVGQYLIQDIRRSRAFFNQGTAD